MPPKPCWVVGLASTFTGAAKAMNRYTFSKIYLTTQNYICNLSAQNELYVTNIKWQIIAFYPKISKYVNLLLLPKQQRDSLFK